MKTLSIVKVFLLSTVLAIPVFAAESTVTPIETLILEMASKPEHHAAIAKYYNDKADEAKADLAMHQKMRKAYLGSFEKTQFSVTAMKKHCDRLISLNEAAIKEYEKMALEHERAAGGNR
jgi:hypothetical protein